MHTSAAAGGADAPVPHDDPHGRWDELVGAALDDVEAIAGRFVERTLAVPAYADSPVPATDIRRTAVDSFRGLLRRVADRADGADPVEELDELATGLGARRARAGIPLESLMTAVRLDFSIIWEHLTQQADEADAPLLVRRASRLWDVVDDYADRVRASYADEVARMAAEASSLRQDLIAAVFGPSAHTHEGRERILDGLGLGRADRFLVAVARAEDVPALREAVALARRRGETGFGHSLGADAVVFWRAPGTPEAAAALRGLLEPLRCGLVLDVAGVEGIAQAARTASLLAAALGPEEDRALTLARGWRRIARAALAEEGIDLREPVETALEALRPADREVLVATVRAYLETGSIAEVAAREYCHRNTVLNRLRRLEELSGVDVTVPEQAALLAVAWS